MTPAPRGPISRNCAYVNDCDKRDGRRKEGKWRGRGTAAGREAARQSFVTYPRAARELLAVVGRTQALVHARATSERGLYMCERARSCFLIGRPSSQRGARDPRQQQQQQRRQRQTSGMRPWDVRDGQCQQRLVSRRSISVDAA
ncbi:hypothetical protein chiPu_0008885 [Chiloscyllium punctatum]|uniref:Uncharacterized protein n=1 Tax=Chiloscyllium punctatum TaxID=137246 RepID=A0A401SJ47_CHIPU|nr:hypothetical protein [Chiloscyllium punctatum]